MEEDVVLFEHQLTKGDLATAVELFRRQHPEHEFVMWTGEPGINGHPGKVIGLARRECFITASEQH